MNAPEPVRLVRSHLELPAPIVHAVLGVDDVASLLGEVRCLTAAVLAGLQHRREVGEFSGADVATEALLALVSRLAADHPQAIDGAILAAPCRCSSDAAAGVKGAVLEVLQANAAAAAARAAETPPEPPRPGMYL